MLNVFKFSCLVLLSLLFCKCANQTQPTGGPQDEEPPELESSKPAQGELNVETRQVELTFNEAIKLNSFKEQLIITPRIDAEYTPRYRKNKVIIDFEDPLSDSTTYTFNFREAIQDITEGNAPDNLKLAFSTGHYLDSMSIDGKIHYILTNDPGTDITVALYTFDDTLDIFTGPPLYFTRTDEEGYYSFENIKVNQYKIYAFADGNKNLTNQSQSESYGFSSQLLQLDTSVTELNIPVQHLDVRELEMQSDRQSGTVYILKFNKHVTSYSLEAEDHPELRISSNFSDDTHQIINIYNNIPIADSLTVFVRAYDSLQTEVIDTAYVKFEETRRKPAEFKTPLSLEKIITDRRLVNGVINFSKPVQRINFDSTYIYIDSLHIYPLDSTHFTWNFYKDKLEISYLLDKSLFQEKQEEEIPQEPASQSLPSTPDSLGATSPALDSLNSEESPPKPEQPPHIYLAAASFISAEQDSSQLVKQELSFSKPEQFGTIIVEIQTDEPNYFIQLLDSKNQVVQETYNLANFEFKYIEPGAYRMRILIDSNQNGQWDAGNILTNTEPEPILFYYSSTDEQEITIRANFEIVPDPITF